MDRLGSFYPLTRPEPRTPVKTLSDEIERLPSVRLESNSRYITTTNTVASFKPHVIHNLADYRRNDETILLLPNIDVAIDHLLDFEREGTL